MSETKRVEPWMREAAKKCAEHVTVKKGNFQSLVVDAMQKHIAEAYAASLSKESPSPDREMAVIHFAVSDLLEGETKGHIHSQCARIAKDWAALNSTGPDEQSAYMRGFCDGQNGLQRALNSTGAEYPKPCGICSGMIQSKDDLDWHGYGNCRDIPDIVLANLNIAQLLRDLQGHIAGELGERLDAAVAALNSSGVESPKPAKETSMEKVDHSPLPWTFTYFTKPDGSDIKTPQDVADTTAFSALRCEGTTLCGVTLDELDDEGRTVVICYTGNGPHSEANARLIAAAVNALNITEPVRAGVESPTLSTKGKP
jgi:hypothetical protein